MKIFGARCLVKERKNDDKLDSGIIISGRSKEPTYQGTVIKVGNGAILENGERVPMFVKEGDEILYTTFSGSPVRDESGEEYIILNERDILAVLE